MRFGGESWRGQRVAKAMAEVLVAVGFATLLVDLLDRASPITGLGVVYLLAVLFVAIRQGEVAALATAVLSVLTLNYFFIEPRHRLTIADSENVVALAVFLIAAIVVGRLAAVARRRAEEAEQRAQLALAREREAKILAEAASSMLEAEGLEDKLGAIAGSVESTAAGLRIGLTAAPEAQPGELAVPLSSRERPGWLYGPDHGDWRRGDLVRLAGPLGGLIDLAREHQRISAHSAEVEATRLADVAKTALLHAISHDLRSPLTAITTAAGGLRAGGLSDGDRDSLLSVIEGESERLARLVDDLLDLSKIEAGAVNPRTDWCDLSDVVVSAASILLARRGDHPIDFDMPGDMPLVQADAAQLERVFSNLIENAIAYSPPQEPVRVSGGTGAGRVSVRITDRGRGIPTSKQAQVFEPFYQGRESNKGSGLGLAICRGFVEANGGRIDLQSTSGSGTSFAVSFPLVRQPAAAE